MKLLNALSQITPKQKKAIYIALAVLLGLILTALAVGLSVRGAMLKKAMTKAEGVLLRDYNIDFKVRDYRFTGLATVTFDHIEVLPREREQLADIKQMAVTVRLWPLLFGDVKIGNLVLNNAKVTLVKKDSVSNYDFLFKKKEKAKEKGDDERNYAALIDGLMKKVFFKIPSNMELDNFELSYQDDSLQQRIRVPRAEIDGGDFETSLFLNEHDAQWNFSGHVNPDKQQLLVKVSSEQKQVELPLLRRKLGLGVSFDEVMFDLRKVKREGRDSLTVAGKWSFTNLKVNHRRLSERDILLPEGLGEGQINISRNALEVNPGSTIQVKEFVFQPYLKFVPKPHKTLALSVHTGKFEAEKLFDAIPEGLFPALEGIKVSGRIAYDLDFSVNFDQPDKLVFSSKMDDAELKVIQWGKADIKTMNTAFTYDAYEDSVLMRQIVLGPQNPKFTPLNQIAPILKNSFKYRGSIFLST